MTLITVPPRLVPDDAVTFKPSFREKEQAALWGARQNSSLTHFLLDPIRERFTVDTSLRAKLTKELQTTKDWRKGFEANNYRHTGQSSQRAEWAAVRLHHQRYALGLVEYLREQGHETLAVLRETGEAMLANGVQARPRDITDHDDGIALQTGKRLKITSDKLYELAQELELLRYQTQKFTWLAPDESLRYRPPKTLRGLSDIEVAHKIMHEMERETKIEVTNRHIENVYGIALAIGRIPAGLWKSFVNSAPEQALGLPSFASSFSVAAQVEFANYQHKGWLFRKGKEPEDFTLGNKDSDHFKTRADSAPKNRWFALLIGVGALKNIQLMGPQSIEEIRKVGELVRERGYVMDDEVKDPYQGIKLLTDGDPDYAVLKPELMDDLAYAHHQLWLDLRVESFKLPKVLQQTSIQERNEIDGAHVKWDRDQEDKARWLGDQAYVYGLAICLEDLRFHHPDKYSQILTSSELSQPNTV